METFFLSSELSLLGLALSGFLSATLLPGSSEALLLLYLEQSAVEPLLLITVVGLANTLGGMSTLWLGRWSQQQLVARGRYREPSSAAIAKVRRWGAPILLLSWVPLIGDGLCLAAGWLKLAWLPSMLAMLLGKSLRYAALAYWWLGQV